MLADDNKPLIAFVLSFLVPGLGHVLVNKTTKKGVVMFVIALVLAVVGIFTLFLVNLLWALFCGYDAYMEAQGKPVWKF